MNRITILSGDDWEAMWVNERLSTQGHEITISHIAKLCPIASIDEFYISDEGISQLEEEGQFPDISLAEAMATYV